MQNDFVHIPPHLSVLLDILSAVLLVALIQAHCWRICTLYCSTWPFSNHLLSCIGLKQHCSCQLNMHVQLQVICSFFHKEDNVQTSYCTPSLHFLTHLSSLNMKYVKVQKQHAPWMVEFRLACTAMSHSLSQQNLWLWFSALKCWAVERRMNDVCSANAAEQYKGRGNPLGALFLDHVS